MAPHKINQAEVGEVMALTPMQEGMLFHYLKGGDGDFYFEQLCLEVEGSINRSHFEQAWNFVIESNSLLRTLFRWEGVERPVQIVLRTYRLKPRYHNFPNGEGRSRSRWLATIRAKDRQEKFDLREVPFRVALCRLDGAGKYQLMISNHHILYDGWSTGIILREFMEAYSRISQNLAPPKRRKADFKTYVKRLKPVDQGEQRQFWRRYLSGIDSKTELLVRKEGKGEGDRSTRESIQLGIGELSRLEHSAGELRVTPALFFYVAWGILLQRYGNKDDVLFGHTVSGRPADIKGIEDMVGLCIHTLPLRINSEKSERIQDILIGVQEDIRRRSPYEFSSLTEIKESLPLTAPGDLFDTVVSIENYPLDKVLLSSNGSLNLKSYSIFESPHYDLTVAVTLFEGIRIDFIFNGKRFSPETIRRLSSHFIVLLANMIENPRIEAGAVDMLTLKERDEILLAFNNTHSRFPEGKNVVELFEIQVRRHTDKVAVALEDEATTYSELERRTTLAAAAMRSQCRQAGSIAGLMVDRSIQWIVGMLGILKCGGAFSPLDPGSPSARNRLIMADLGTTVIVSRLSTRREYPEFFKSTGEAVVVYIDEYSRFEHTPETIFTGINAGDPAYVMYTSGTTGKPKGVVIEHRALLNLCGWHNRYFEVQSSDRASQYAGIGFDASIWEVFPNMLNGVSLFIVPENIKLDIEKLHDFFIRTDIALAFLPTPVYEQFFHRPNVSLKKILTGGDKLHSYIARDYRLFNNYGPTENCVVSTACPVDRYRPNIPIGRPIDNARIYILNSAHFSLQPVGVAGELCIAGTSLARGYLNEVEMNQEKFTRHVDLKGERLYRTGDLARWLPGGEIEFLGRIDRQVQIRGLRIELGEIENRLLKHHGLREARVLARKENNGTTLLCAYLVSDQPFEPADLCEFLARDLPDYMIPSHFFRLDELPLTPNGKVDEKALPAPLPLSETRRYLSPRNPVEEKIAAIWADVLGKDSGNISVDDNFFHLGGHSIRATRVVFKVNRAFGTHIELKDLFENATIVGLARKVEESGGEGFVGLTPTSEKGYYDLSYAQRRLWILCQFEEDSTAYNMPAAFVVTGGLKIDIFEQAVRGLIDRHESLRTVFVKVEGEPKQQVLAELPFELEQTDLRRLDETARDEEARHIFLELADHTFHLEAGPLFLFRLLRLRKDEWLLIFNMHHIITDGWSIGIIKKELSILYNAFLEGRCSPLPPLRLQYRDYSAWHNRLIGEDAFKESERYWLEKFRDRPNGIELPLDHGRPVIQTFNGGRVSFVVDREQSDRLYRLGRDQDATLFMTLLSLVGVFLYRYTGQEDVILGAPIAGRKQPELYGMIGFLVNTLIYRLDIRAEMSFREVLHRARRETLSAYEHQDYPFDLLIDRLGLDRDLSQSPLFNVMLAHNNAGTWETDLDLAGVGFQRYRHSEEFNLSKFDLIFFMDEVEAEQGIYVTIEYNSDLFDRARIERMGRHFLGLIRSLAGDGPERPVSSLDYMDRAEYEEVVNRFNATAREFPGVTVQEMFEDQCRRTANRVGVVSGDSHIGYGELNRRVNRLAVYLRESFAVVPGAIVGISVDRCPELIISLLGIVKSGGGYVAMDPHYPPERVLHILQDSRCNLVIDDHRRPELFRDYTGERLDIFSLEAVLSNAGAVNPEPVNAFADILYVIYTSGSTGIPNGAMLSHGLLSNLIQWQRNESGIDCSGRCLQFTSVNFCVSFQEIVGTLTGGGELHLIGELVRQDIDYLMDFLVLHRIEVLYLPFSYLNFLFTQSGRWGGDFRHRLRHIVTAGEQLKISVGMKGFLDLNPGLQLHNHYGSSEMHVVTSYTMTGELVSVGDLPPAGRPVSNTRIFILDSQGRVVPLGVWGELCIQGSVEIAGYIHNDELTAHKLRVHDLAGGGDGRLYYSGDIGRWRPDGTIELQGRKDFQVKVRGFRVEPGEIESKILSIPGVRDCVVVVREREGGEKQLWGYVVTESLELSAVRRELGHSLPQYMIPRLQLLASLPLLPNGKVDREGLPELSGDTSGDVAAPRDALDAEMVGLWSELLGLPEPVIGIDHNFFELGGHSLKATVLTSRLYRAFHVRVPLVEVFRCPTVRELSDFVRGSRRVDYESIPPVEKREYYPLSSGQRRLYILQQLAPQRVNYNLPTILRLQGAVERENIEQVLKRLIDRHESLRTSFLLVENEPAQRVSDGVFFEITDRSIDKKRSMPGTEAVKTAMAHFVRPFDLKRAPLLRAGLLELSGSECLLMVDMHHIIADGTSLGIMVREFTNSFHHEHLGPLKIQYKEFSAWQNRLLKSENIKQQQGFWMAKFSGNLPVLNLPADFPRPLSRSYEGDRFTFKIEKELKQRIKTVVLENNITYYMFLLTIYYTLLSRYSGQDDIIVGTGIAGRRREEFENTVGMFINMLALRGSPREGQSFCEFLDGVRESTVQAFENQDYQFEELVKALNLKRDPDRNPLFDTIFQMQNFEIPPMEMAGMSITPYEYNFRISRFDLVFYAVEHEEGIDIEVIYATELYKRTTIERIGKNFLEVIRQVLDNRDMLLRDINISGDLLKAKSDKLLQSGLDFEF